MAKPDGTEWISTYLDTETKRRLRVMAAERDTSMAALCAEIITKYIKRKERK